jgi:hypothetical protein
MLIPFRHLKRLSLGLSFALISLTASCKEDELDAIKQELDSFAKPTIDGLLKNTELLWQALEKTLEAKEFWQLIATIEAVLIVVVFFWGVGLGSSAKRDVLAMRHQRSQRYELE